jgi:hypothetical protein
MQNGPQTMQRSAGRNIYNLVINVFFRVVGVVSGYAGGMFSFLFFFCHIDGAQLAPIAELGKILGKWHLIEGTRYICSDSGIVDFCIGICTFNRLEI